MFSTDKPINYITEDKLGRSAFACQLANAIMQFKTKDNYAISLQGKWGCGKTSVLNMAIEEIKRLSEPLEEKKRTVIVKFNPWNFTDTTQLISQFFITLSNSLKIDNKEQNKKDVGTVIEEYSSALEYSEYIPVVGKYLKLLPKFSSKLGKSMREAAEKKLNDVSYRKGEVEKALLKLDQRILVVIDDIDRLPNGQIRLIFQLVSAVAGLPNITYLLIFDNEIVARALGEVQHCDGEEYLEKIIQVPFDVPPLNIQKVHGILSEKLNNLIEIHNGLEFDAEHWSEVFQFCISPFVETLRDIDRFCNALSFMYAAVKQEVDFIDIAGICALRVFAPPIYEWIRNNKFSLVGGYSGGGIVMNDIDKQKNKALLLFEETYPQSPDVMLNAVASLFPLFSNSVSYHSNYTSRDDNHQAMRIASESKFDVYFSLSLENIKISRREVDSSLLEMEESELRTYINFLKDRELFESYLTEVDHNLSRIPEERVELILSALLFQGGIITEEKNTLIGANSANISVNTISNILFRIEDESNRYAIIEKMLANTDFMSFQFLLDLLYVIETTHSRISKASSMRKDELITLEHLYELEKLFLERTRVFVQDVHLLDWQEARMASMLWEFLEEQEYNDYIKDALQDNILVLKYMSNKAHRWSSSSGSYSYSFQEKSYKEHIDDSQVIKIINDLRMTESFWDLEKRVIETAIAFSLPKYADKDTGVDSLHINDAMKSWKAEFDEQKKMQR